MDHMDTDRNLLFGVLALQADLLDNNQFAQACTLWSARKATPLAELLVQQRWLTDEDRGHVEFLLQRKLKKHHDDARASLAEVTTDRVRLSLAGVWYGFVSLPLFQFLLLRWYWRIFIWTRFLWQVSRIRLNLVPTHPDLLGGLGFLANTADAFAVLLVAHGAMLAGLIASRVFFLGATSDEDFLSGMALCDTVVFPYLEVGQSSSGPISQALELGCRVVASRTHTFLQLERYHRNTIEFFDIGNHLELAARILARPQFDADANRGLP